MATGSNVTIKINHKNVPILEKALEYAEMGLIPAGAYSNRNYVGNDVYINKDLSKNIEDVLFDPQTSGGLLISIPKNKADKLMEELKTTPTDFAIIGEVYEKEEYYVVVE